MIKVNLATRKQAAAAGGGKGGKQSVLGAGINAADLDKLKELPIRRIVVCVATYFIMQYSLESYQTDELAKADEILAKLTAEASKFNTALGKTQGYEVLKKELDQNETFIRTKIETIELLVAGRANPPKLLTALSAAMPNDAWLESFIINDQGVSVRGTSLDFNQISDLMRNLSQSAFFTDVAIQTTEQVKDTKGVELAVFELKAKRR